MVHPEAIFSLFVILSLCGAMVLDFHLSNHQIDERAVKKSRPVLYAAFSLCFLWPLFNFGLYLLAPEYEILIGTWGTGVFFQILFHFLAFLSGSLLSLFHYHLETGHKLGDRVFLGLTISGLVVFMLLSNLVCLFFGRGNCNHSFSSPDGAHTIVVRESSLIHHVRVTVYERVNPLLVRLRASKVTGSTIKPVETDHYSIRWYEDGVTFFFDSGGADSISVSFDPGRTVS